MDSYKYLGIPTESYGFLYGFLWIHIIAYGFLLFLIDSYGFLRTPVDSDGFTVSLPDAPSPP